VLYRDTRETLQVWLAQGAQFSLLFFIIESLLTTTTQGQPIRMVLECDAGGNSWELG
jgi:hypothetical protein